MRRKILAMFIVVVIMVTGLSSVVVSAEMISGNGWSFDTVSRVLTITTNEGTTNWGNNGHGYIGIRNADNSQTVYSVNAVIIQDSVTAIGENAFRNMSYWTTSITIPNSITRVGAGAFDNTVWLNNQPNGVVYVGRVAYTYKGDMPTNTSLSLQAFIVGIASSAFSNQINLASITIPDSVMNIGERAFMDCTNLETVTIGNSLTNIERETFRNCSALTSITIPDSVTSIGMQAFMDCTNLESVIIGDSVTSIGSWAFGYCTNITSITISDSITDIELGAFDGTAWLNNQPNGMVYLGKVAYRHKGNPPVDTSITLLNGTKGIAGGAFFQVRNLISITIPDTVTSIGRRAFSYCINLESVTFRSITPPNIFVSSGGVEDRGIFTECDELTTIYVPIGSKPAYEVVKLLDSTYLTDIFLGDYNIIEIGGLEVSAVAENGYIEICNLADKAISTKVLYLSNDDEDYFLWQMPSVIIRPNDTVRIKDSENNSNGFLKRMQTNFELNIGEDLRLIDSEGNVLTVVDVA